MKLFLANASISRNLSAERLQDDRDLQVVEAFGLAMVAFVSVFGNLIVTLCLAKRQKLVTPSNRLVFSLTASNFLFSLMVLPFSFIARIQEEWNFGSFWCDFSGFITLFVSIASTVTIAMIAIDRYLAIVKPMLYSLQMTNRRAICLLIWVWLFSLICSIPPFMNWSRFQYGNGRFACFVQFQGHPYYFSIYLLVSFLLPLTTMIICYYLIFQVARTKCRKISVGVLGQTLHEITPTLLSPSLTHHHSSPALSYKAHRKPSWIFQPESIPIKGIWTICIILGSFIISYSPHIIYVCSITFLPNSPLPSWCDFWSLLFLYSSSATYAFIYGLYNRTIRKEIKSFLFSKSSEIFQGLPPKYSTKKMSQNWSIMDFSVFKLKSPRSAPHLSSQCQTIPYSAPLWRENSLRKYSQDSGAVMTTGEIGDLEPEFPLIMLRHSPMLQRHYSAPSLFTSDLRAQDNLQHDSPISSSYRNSTSLERKRHRTRTFSLNNDDLSDSQQTVDNLKDNISFKPLFFNGRINSSILEGHFLKRPGSAVRAFPGKPSNPTRVVFISTASRQRLDDEGIENDCMLEELPNQL